jgi:hypothetical protein
MADGRGMYTRRGHKKLRIGSWWPTRTHRKPILLWGAGPNQQGVILCSRGLRQWRLPKVDSTCSDHNNTHRKLKRTRISCGWSCHSPPAHSHFDNSTLRNKKQKKLISAFFIGYFWAAGVLYIVSQSLPFIYTPLTSSESQTILYLCVHLEHTHFTFWSTSNLYIFLRIYIYQEKKKDLNYIS